MNKLFIVLSLIALTSLCDTINQLILKSAVDSLDFSPTFNIARILRFFFSLIIKPRLWLAFIFSIISLCIWLLALSKAGLTFAFSADSMHYIFIAFASWLVFRKDLTLYAGLAQH